MNEDMAMIGVWGRDNPGFIAAMRRELRVEKIYIPAEPEFGAATGAAVVAAEDAETSLIVAPDFPKNDGKQAPMRGHAVFIAQHRDFADTPFPGTKTGCAQVASP